MRGAACPCLLDRATARARAGQPTPCPRCGSDGAAPALLAPYAPHVGYGSMAASLETFSTTAPPCSRAAAVSEPSNARVRRNGPSRLVASAVSKSSHAVSASSASGTGPSADALFDQHVDAAEQAADLHRKGIDVFLVRISPTIPATSRARRRHLGQAPWWRATKATRAPRASSSSINARPSPEVPPVSATRMPCRVLCVWFHAGSPVQDETIASPAPVSMAR